MRKKQYNALELFAGCGGLIDGFKQTGLYKTLACVEWEKKQAEVLQKRLKSKHGYDNAKNIVLRFDVQRTKELLEGWEDPEYGRSTGLRALVNGETVDVITGGPPCQAYSLAGRIQDPDRMRFDYRNYLFESYCKIVGEFRPKVFVFENVEGMLTAKPGGLNIINDMRKNFQDIGYSIVDDIRKHALIDFSEYGVPQMRKRVILVGLNNDYFQDPAKILQMFYFSFLPKYKESMKTVFDAISDLPKLFPVDEHEVKGKKYSHSISSCSISHHEPRFHNRRDIEIFNVLARDVQTGSNAYSNTRALRELYTNKTGRTSNVHKYHVLRWNKPSNTIPAHLKKDGLRHIHPDPEQARSITVREAARLQTFGDDFEFSGVMSKDFEMIGNAVPPKFACKLACAVNELLEKYQDKHPSNK